MTVPYPKSIKFLGTVSVPDTSWSGTEENKCLYIVHYFMKWFNMLENKIFGVFGGGDYQVYVINPPNKYVPDLLGIGFDIIVSVDTDDAKCWGRGLKLDPHIFNELFIYEYNLYSCGKDNIEDLVRKSKNIGLKFDSEVFYRAYQ